MGQVSIFNLNLSLHSQFSLTCCRLNFISLAWEALGGKMTGFLQSGRIGQTHDLKAMLSMWAQAVTAAWLRGGQAGSLFPLLALALLAQINKQTKQKTESFHWPGGASTLLMRRRRPSTLASPCAAWTHAPFDLCFFSSHSTSQIRVLVFKLQFIKCFQSFAISIAEGKRLYFLASCGQVIGPVPWASISQQPLHSHGAWDPAGSLQPIITPFSFPNYPGPIGPTQTPSLAFAI